MKSIAALQELLFPVRCIGCRALGLSICSQCRRYWNPHIYRTYSVTTPHFPIYSAIQYSPIASKVILSAKESGHVLADQLIVDAITHALEIALREGEMGSLVPIPSRPNIARLRGRQFISELTHCIAQELHLDVLDVLSHSRKVRDQSSLSALQREQNLHGALQCVIPIREKVILVDDLVTTGATLAEAARAMRQAGAEVIAAVSACVATPLR